MCRFSHFQRRLVTTTYSTDNSVMLSCPLLWWESMTLGFLYILFFLPILAYTAQYPFTTPPRSYLPHSDSHSCLSNIIQITRESPLSSACAVWSINHCPWFVKESEVVIFPVAQKKDHSNSDYPVASIIEYTWPQIGEYLMKEPTSHSFEDSSEVSAAHYHFLLWLLVVVYISKI